METERIAEQVMAFCSGQQQEVVTWLTSLGCRVVRADDGCWIMDGIAGVRSGLLANSEPATTAVCIALLLAGGMWPIAYPRLLETCDRAWKKRTVAT